MPSRAGSPGSGSRLKIWPSGSPLTPALPTCDAGEQPRPRNAASEQRGLAFGLPTRPGGRLSLTLLGVEANVALMVTLRGRRPVSSRSRP